MPALVRDSNATLARTFGHTKTQNNNTESKTKTMKANLVQRFFAIVGFLALIACTFSIAAVAQTSNTPAVPQVGDASTEMVQSEAATPTIEDIPPDISMFRSLEVLASWMVTQVRAAQVGIWPGNRVVKWYDTSFKEVARWGSPQTYQTLIGALNRFITVDLIDPIEGVSTSANLVDAAGHLVFNGSTFGMPQEMKVGFYNTDPITLQPAYFIYVPARGVVSAEYIPGPDAPESDYRRSLKIDNGYMVIPWVIAGRAGYITLTSKEGKVAVYDIPTGKVVGVHNLMVHAWSTGIDGYMNFGESSGTINLTVGRDQNGYDTVPTVIRRCTPQNLGLNVVVETSGGVRPYGYNIRRSEDTSPYGANVMTPDGRLDVKVGDPGEYRIVPLFDEKVLRRAPSKLNYYDDGGKG